MLTKVEQKKITRLQATVTELREQNVRLTQQLAASQRELREAATDLLARGRTLAAKGKET